MHVLVALAERPGEVVTREELMTRVWNGVFVTDDVLHRAVRELRRLFDDDSEQPKVIETIRKRGYRLIATVGPVGRVGQVGPDHPDLTSRFISIAVLLAIAALVTAVLLTRRSAVSTEAHVRFMPLTSDPGKWLSDRNGGGARPLTRSAVYKSPARWSPDNRHLTFTTRNDRRSDLWLLDVEDGEAKTLVSDPTSAVAPSWSRDGRSIYFGSLRTSDWQIWNVEVETGHVRQVTTDGGYAALESADGRSLFIRRLDRLGLWHRPVAAARRRSSPSRWRPSNGRTGVSSTAASTSSRGRMTANRSSTSSSPPLQITRSPDRRFRWPASPSSPGPASPCRATAAASSMLTPTGEAPTSAACRSSGEISRA